MRKIGSFQWPPQPERVHVFHEKNVNNNATFRMFYSDHFHIESALYGWLQLKMFSRSRSYSETEYTVCTSAAEGRLCGVEARLFSRFLFLVFFGRCIFTQPCCLAVSILVLIYHCSVLTWHVSIVSASCFYLLRQLRRSSTFTWHGVGGHTRPRTCSVTCRLL